MLATFLLTVGHNSRYCLIRKTFSRSHFSTSRSFNKILKALNTIAVDMMVKPGSTAPEKIRESTRFYPYFKDCIGAIDGTHIPASVIGRDKSSYRNRHWIISQNVLAACNFDLEFIYVLSGWEGSAHDSKVLNDALSRRNGLKVPHGKYFLVDCGFPNRRQFLAPVRGVRYHLQDFAGQGRDPENANELFNLRYASLRNCISGLLNKDCRDCLDSAAQLVKYRKESEEDNESTMTNKKKEPETEILASCSFSESRLCLHSTL
ncbi:hypothetical protein Q3G72_008194 [Acer saccharum]|nr:hypothetical protein Q3G72_008194 [Acer saccharum]